MVTLAEALIALRPPLSEELSKRGLTVRKPAPADFIAVVAAQRAIQCIPDLWDVVARLVGRISPLVNTDDAYDVSHSEPLLGDMILLSIPPDVKSARLRLSEEVIHEAMHINLSALEQVTPLVQSSKLLHSPWRATLREASGVLHGLYVFGCLACFMQRVISSDQFSPHEKAHSRRRIEEIDAELAAIEYDALVPNLTKEGASLAGEILAASEIRRQAVFER